MRVFIFIFFLFGRDIQAIAQSCMLVRYDAVFNEDFDRGNTPVRYDAILFSWPERSYFVASRDPGMAKTGPAEVADLQPDTLWRTSKFLQEDALIFGAYSFEGKEILYRDSLHPMTWVLDGETKKIDSIDCYRATALFRGRTYVAWYAPSIPITNGPWKLGGLPGLIMEAYDERKDLYFRFRSMQPAQAAKPYRNYGPASGFAPYSQYVDYILQAVRRIRDMLSAQQDSQCLDCQTKSQVNIYLWEKISD
jgi:hypothetical protein